MQRQSDHDEAAPSQEECDTRGRENATTQRETEERPVAVLDVEQMLSPFQATEWQSLSPGERLVRAWALRRRLVNPQDAHDRKLFPAP